MGKTSSFLFLALFGSRVDSLLGSLCGRLDRGIVVMAFTGLFCSSPLASQALAFGVIRPGRLFLRRALHLLCRESIEFTALKGI